MRATMTYPGSRIRSSGQCNKCRGFPGDMQDTGRIKLHDASGKTIELLKWTCDKCGYTVLFDLDVARNNLWQDTEFCEVLPE
jgi:predicted nucleic-acid-binding Zn-ribbon protein